MTGTIHRVPTDPAAPHRRPRRRRPGPFPISIVQAATTVAPVATAD